MNFLQICYLLICRYIEFISTNRLNPFSGSEFIYIVLSVQQLFISFTDSSWTWPQFLIVLVCYFPVMLFLPFTHIMNIP